MRHAVIPLSMVLAIAVWVAGCGDSSETEAAKEAGTVAIAYTGAMSRLDFRAACKLEFTNRGGPAYQGMTEADKKRECESGWSHNHPLQPGAPGPPELGQIKHVFGLAPAVVQSAEVSGDSATVVLRDPKNGAHRDVRLRHEGDRWLVYEVETGALMGP